MSNFITSLIIYILLFLFAVVKDGIAAKRACIIMVIWSSICTGLVFEGEYTETLFWKIVLLAFHVVVGLLACMFVGIFNDNISKARKSKGIPEPLKRKSKLLTAFLAIFGGLLGLQKFYLRKPVIGALYLFFWWTTIPAWIGLIEGVYYLLISKEEFDNKYNNGFNNSSYQKQNVDQSNQTTFQNIQKHNQNVSPDENRDNSSSEVVNIESCPITIGSFKAKGVLDDFIITIFDSNGKKYEFRSKGGEIDSFKIGMKEKLYSEV